MDWIRRFLQLGPKDSHSESKRLAKLTEAEVDAEVLNARAVLLKKYRLEYISKMGDGPGRGFLNLGNTCFISATLQCLLHCKELLKEFCGQGWEPFLNPLTSAFQGKLVLEFYQLIVIYWKGSGKGPLDISAFHHTMSTVNRELEDFAQHDSQEFLAFFLDGLLDDLNKKIVRRFEEIPEWKGEQIQTYCERAQETFARRNKSFMAEIFYGQFCSQIECPSPECGRRSVSCEPFNMLSLDPPSTTSVIDFQFRIIPATCDNNPQQLTVRCLDNEPLDTLLQHISNQRPELAGPRFRRLLYRGYDLQSAAPDLSRLTSGSLFYSYSSLVLAETLSTHILSLLFDIPETEPLNPDDGSWGALTIVPLNNRFREGFERVLWVPRTANRSKIQLAVYLVFRRLFHECGFFPADLDPAVPPPSFEALAKEFGLLSGQMSDLGFKTPLDLRIFSRNFEITAGEGLFEVAGVNSLDVRVYFAFPEQRIRRLFLAEDSFELPPLPFDHSPVTLEACLDKFSRQETLDQENMWFCPGCRELKKASKKMLVSRLPRVLVVHLKRFKRVAPDRPHFRKFTDQISFPVHGLDLSAHCVDKDAPAVFDLFAVSSHTGNVSNGHYVSFCKSLQSSEWTCYDDRLVRPASEADVTNKNAYLLFYSLRVN